MKKTIMIVAVLGLVVGMKISTVSSFENKNKYDDFDSKYNRGVEEGFSCH